MSWIGIRLLFFQRVLNPSPGLLAPTLHLWFWTILIISNPPVAIRLPRSRLIWLHPSPSCQLAQPGHRRLQREKKNKREVKKVLWSWRQKIYIIAYGCRPAGIGDFQLSKYILRHYLLIFVLFISTNFSNFFFNIENGALLMFSLLKISFMVCPAQSPQTITALVASWWIIFAGMCLFVFIYASADSWDGWGKRSLEKKLFFNVTVKLWKFSGNIAATL